MAQKGRTASLKIEDFSGGLNTRFANTEVKNNESPDLLNVVFDNKGEIRKRNGFEKVTAAGPGTGSPARDQFLYLKNDATQQHIVSSGTDILQRTSPAGLTWSSIKTFGAFSLGASTTQFDITNPVGTTFRYTWDGTGTNPDIGGTVAVGDEVVIAAQFFNAANNLTADVTAVGTDYFEITNAAGVAENNKDIGTGSITLTFQEQRSCFIEIDDLLYIGNSFNSWGKYDGTTVTDVTTIPHGNICIYFQEKLWVAGNRSNPSTLSFSKTNSVLGDVEDFTIASGGGLLLIGKDDGQKITALKVLGSNLIVFKERSIYVVSFNDTAGAYSQEILDPIFGCASPDAATNVQNDIMFFTGDEVRRLGFDAEYFQQIRTNPISEVINDQFETLINKNNSYLTFFDKKLYVGVSKNTTTVDTTFVLDTRYSGWSKWDSLNINGFLADTVNDRLYFSDHTASQVFLINDSFSDDGTAISARWSSKSFDMDNQEFYKRFRWFYITSRNALGELCYQTKVLDNNNVTVSSEICMNIGQFQSAALWGTTDWGLDDFDVGDTTTEDPTLIYNRISLGGGQVPKGLAIQFVFTNANLDEDLSIEALTLIFSTKDIRHYPFTHTR